MITDILLPVTETSGEEDAIAAAIALASEYNAHLALVLPLSCPLPVSGPWGASDLMLDEMLTQFRAEAMTKASRLRDRLGKEAISWEVRIADAGLADPIPMLARQARYADLSILPAPRPGASDATVARAYFSAMLFESGRPVLVIPAGRAIRLPIRHVALAWRPTREAVRALNDALGLLEDNIAIDVVTIQSAGQDANGPSGAAIGTHLKRHDLRVNVVDRAGGSQSVAAELLGHAAEANAQFLIAGGYGHSRLREWMLGGTTRELLETARLPILFSH